MKLEFKEQQKFNQWWLWIILIEIAILSIFGIYKQLIVEKKFGSKPMSDIGLIFFTVFIFSLIVLFRTMQLKTEINEAGLKLSFFPFVNMKVNWNEIKSTKIVNYGFVGGWGIRIGTKYGTVYNMKGKFGLAIELKNGKKFLIGTQKETELTEIISKIYPVGDKAFNN